jgi:alpha-1,6-mannosyltransferase
MPPRALADRLRRLDPGPRRHGGWWIGLLATAVYAVFALVLAPRPAPLARELVGWLGLPALLLLQRSGSSRVRATGRASRAWVLGFFPVLAVVLLAVPAFHSSDVHLYVNVGWLQAHYHLNPYVHTMADVGASDPMLDARWADAPCPYGFLFALVARGLAVLGGGDPARTVLLFKGFEVLVLAALGGLLWSTVRRLRPGDEERARFLLLWSPLLLLHHVANGHNDLVVALGLLIAIRAAVDARPVPSLLGLAVAVLWKHVAIVAAPFLLLHLARRSGVRRTLLAIVPAAALAVGVALPYVAAGDALRIGDVVVALVQPAGSLVAAVTDAWRYLGRAVPALAPSTPAVTDAVRLAALAAFVVFLADRFRRAVRRPAARWEDLVEDVVATCFVLVFLASPILHPWYPGMFLAVALLLVADGPWCHATWVLANVQLFAFTFLGKARILDALVLVALPCVLLWRRRTVKPEPGAVFTVGGP